jgi:plastocyanin
MIWRSLIFSSLFACCIEGATISGSIILKDSHADAVVKRKDYSGVVIYAEPLNGNTAVLSPRHVTMLQKNKMFTPHLLPIATGSTVDFPNADPIFHNAFSSFSGQIFDIGLYAPGSSRSVRFSKAGVVRVFCNIHPTMSAIILVVNTDSFVKSVRDGSFDLNLPPGEYTLGIFHERATEQTLSGLSRRITVTEQGVRLGVIEVSEAGYLLAPHKNKYGKDYVPPPDDQIVYPGVRN